jgi:LmbE family N-acetylglucosaminyl deacetylase
MVERTRRRIALLSPHPDDLALSIGGTLRVLAEAHAIDATIFTIFSHSQNAGQVAAHGDVAAVTALRRAEDESYARAIGAELRHLGFPDSTRRQAVGEPVSFAEVVRDGRLLAAVTEQLRAAVVGVGFEVIFAPLAFGENPDHQITRHVITEGEPVGEVVFYEDLPYGSWFGDQAKVAEYASAGLRRARPLALDIDRMVGAKADDIRRYPSQVDETWISATLSYARSIRPGVAVERFWPTSPAFLEWLSGLAS